VIRDILRSWTEISVIEPDSGDSVKLGAKSNHLDNSLP
jgi:hypothetical protein